MRRLSCLLRLSLPPEMGETIAVTGGNGSRKRSSPPRPPRSLRKDLFLGRGSFGDGQRCVGIVRCVGGKVRGGFFLFLFRFPPDSDTSPTISERTSAEEKAKDSGPSWSRGSQNWEVK